MNTFIYKRIEIDYASRLELQDALPKLGWAKGMREGWVVGVNDDKQLRGRWVYKDRVEWDYYDEDSLEKLSRTFERRMCAPFAVDYERSILRVESAADAKRIVEALERVRGVRVFVEDLEIDMWGLHDAFTRKYAKSHLDALGLNDVIHEKVLMTNANFKLLDQADRQKAIKRHKDRIKQLHFVVNETPKGGVPCVFPVKLTRGGKVSYDEDAPPQTLSVLEDMVMAFHVPEGTTNAENVDISPQREQGASTKGAADKGDA